MGKYVRTIGEKSSEKPENYACQICRGPKELCQRCQSVGYVWRAEPRPAVSAARKARPRPILYNC